MENKGQREHSGRSHNAEEGGRENLGRHRFQIGLDAMHAVWGLGLAAGWGIWRRRRNGRVLFVSQEKLMVDSVVRVDARNDREGLSSEENEWGGGHHRLLVVSCSSASGLRRR